MSQAPWQRRIERAEELARIHPFAAEILAFYAGIARFQQGLYARLESSSEQLSSPDQSGLAELPLLIASFGDFLVEVIEHGPARMADCARELQNAGREGWSQLLDGCWASIEGSPTLPAEFLARAFLQPYAEWLRVRSGMKWENYNDPVCPFCGRKPGLGVLRPLGDGAQRSLMCSFCSAEWVFRRIVCPECGEEDNSKLPVYTAEEFDYIRVECCDNCKTYLKSINLTRNGLAEPLVDELAAAPLDLWARDHGYTKLQLNLLGL